MSCLFCERSVCGRGLCRIHYERAWKRGELHKFKKKDRGTLRERFMSKVAKPPGGCWDWTGHTNYYGYGLIWDNGRAVRAHRVAFKLFNGALRSNQVVCHSCDNPKCVNPKHLFKGTRLENNRDCATKGRRPSGERHWNSKLAEKDVAEIRASTEPQHVLAGRFGIHQSHISRLRTGTRKLWWGHLASPLNEKGPP